MFFEQLCIALQTLEPIEALVLGGSRAGEVYDQKSDYDLYVYCTELPSPEARMELLRRVCDRIELGNDFWELEDDCVLKNGIPVDILYRSLDAFAQDVAAVVEGYSARNGYTTCMWHNLLHSRVLYDRYGRILFALNRMTHPGEKRMDSTLKATAKLLPKDFGENLDEAFACMFANPERFLEVLDTMVGNLQELVEKETEADGKAI